MITIGLKSGRIKTEKNTTDAWWTAAEIGVGIAFMSYAILQLLITIGNLP